MQAQSIVINHRKISEMTDKFGVRWYPMRAFLENILQRYEHVSAFRDSPKVRPYMRVIDIITFSAKGKPLKNQGWAINEEGVRYLLRNMTVNCKTNSTLYLARVKAQDAACDYFGIPERERGHLLYTYKWPNMDGYPAWAQWCLKTDKSLTEDTTWKLCPECKRYYPFTSNYFEHILAWSPCKLCEGKDMRCTNEVLNAIYKNGGLGFLNEVALAPRQKISNEFIKMIMMMNRRDL